MYILEAGDRLAKTMLGLALGRPTELCCTKVNEWAIKCVSAGDDMETGNSRPALSGSHKEPRKAGNTTGCVCTLLMLPPNGESPKVRPLKTQANDMLAGVSVVVGLWSS